MKNNIDKLKMLGDWISNSGIQKKDSGVYAWYDIDKKEYGFLYSEITGYYITANLFLYKSYGDKKYIEKARKSADWLIKNALSDCGGIKTRLNKDDEKSDPVYSFSGGNIFSFDTGMVCFGMIELYKFTKDLKYLNTAIKMADFLIDKMQNNNGSFTSIYNERNKRRIDLFEKWSDQPGSFHSKLALGFTSLFEVTRNTKYRDSAISVCEFALTKMDKSGRFITNEKTKVTDLHPHCYTVEGLLFVGNYFGIKKFIQAGNRATEWALSYVKKGGIGGVFYPEINDFSKEKRSDTIAQLLRLAILFRKEKGVKKLFVALSEYQNISSSQKTKGGMIYNNENLCVNAWCSMFSLQAFDLYLSKEKKDGLKINLSLLV